MANEYTINKITAPNGDVYNLENTTYESKAAASGGTDVSLVTTGEKYTWNAKSGSDVNVKQEVTTGSANYEVLFSGTADNTTRSEGARKNNNLLFNPSTGNLQTTQLNGVTVGTSPKFTDTNTHRPIQVNGTEILGNNTTALNLKAGSNVSVTNSSGTVTIAATDTTYSSKSAASGGTDVSLVTTGEKYTWNNKSNLTIGTSSTTAAAGNHTHGLSIAADSGTNQLTLGASTKYKLTAGGSSYIFTTPPNTTYGVVSKTANGLAPQLPNETITTKYLRQDGSWQVPPDNNTWNPMTGATSSANGTVGYVNAVPPKDGYNTKYLRADGSWQVPPNTTYSSKAAASGGTDVSLVTTGEKYTWNSKTSNTGTVTKVSTGTGLTGGDITTSGTISLASGVVTAGSAGPTAAVTGTEGTTIAVPRITVDTYGRVTGLTSYNLTNKNTTYSSQAAASGGTAVSLCTTGEKYTWNNKQTKYSATVVTLTSSGWNSSNQQSATVSGVTTSNLVFVSAAPSDIVNYTKAGIYASTQASNSLTFVCGTKPTTDISVNVVVWS